MKQTLQLRISQHLALTPQLQQSIRLLQLSTLELHQELEQILSDNPLLERLDDPLDHSVRLLADGAVSNAPSTPSLEAAAVFFVGFGDAEAGFEGSDAADAPSNTAEADWSFDDVARTSRAPEDEDARPQLEAHETTLREHLLEQMRLTVSTLRDHALVELMIDAVDDNVNQKKKKKKNHTHKPTKLEIDIDELSVALKLLQSFE